MRQSSKVQGTKIAQAAKDLNVTSVTIRRYISEFNIETATDQNGIKVLPSTAMEELTEVRRLKEEGLTNPKVLEHIEAQREKGAKAPKKAVKAKEEEVEKETEKEKTKAKPRVKAKPKADAPVKRKVRGKAEEAAEDAEDESEEPEEEEEKAPAAPRRARRTTVKSDKEQTDEESDESSESEEGGEEGDDASGEGRLKHSLTCQTCGKTFEHLNPRLRDCLDCYRTKRKERRRGGDRHKNVIQHPLAQQVASKMATREQQQQQQQSREQQQAPVREVVKPQPAAHAVGITQPIIGGLKTKVRSYRKAIEETRMITSSLKRRLERPDLPEGDRRWLEQIYAYQLILHQGWRHLSEYRSTTNQQAKQDD